MLPAQAVDTGAIALPARPTHSCSLYLPRPGTQRPLGDGDGGLWIWPGPQPPTGKGRPLVPSAHAGALATRKEEVRRQGLLPAPGCQDPQTSEPPGGCFSGCTSPQSSQLQPDISDGDTEAQREGGPEHSCSALEASLGTNPPAPPLSLPRAAAGTVLGISTEEEKEAALWAGGALGVAPASSLPSP